MQTPILSGAKPCEKLPGLFYIINIIQLSVVIRDMYSVVMYIARGQMVLL